MGRRYQRVTQKDKNIGLFPLAGSPLSHSYLHNYIYIGLYSSIDHQSMNRCSWIFPSAWNDLHVELRSLLMARPSKFYIYLKSFLFGRDWLGAPLSSSVLKRRFIHV